MSWRPISELDKHDDDALVFAVNINRHDRYRGHEPLVLEGWCVASLRETIEGESGDKMPPHLCFGFTHFLLHADMLAAFPLPTE